MPRKSPFSIVLDKHEKKYLEKLARKYTLPYREVIRAKIILLAAQGTGNNVIAERLDTPRQIVNRPRFLGHHLSIKRPALSSAISPREQG